MKKPEEMTNEELREFIKNICQTYIENVNVIVTTPIRLPEEDYSRN